MSGTSSGNLYGWTVGLSAQGITNVRNEECTQETKLIVTMPFTRGPLKEQPGSVDDQN